MHDDSRAEPLICVGRKRAGERNERKREGERERERERSEKLTPKASRILEYYIGNDVSSVCARLCVLQQYLMTDYKHGPTCS